MRTLNNNGDKMGDLKLHKSWWSTRIFFISLGFAIIGSVLSVPFDIYNSAINLGWKDGLFKILEQVNLNFTITWFFVTYVFAKYLRILSDALGVLQKSIDQEKEMENFFTTQKNEIEKVINNLKIDIQEHLPLVHVPRQYKGKKKYFDNSLKVIKGLDKDNIKQIAEKFIANKINFSFSDELQFKIDAQRYSEFSSEIYLLADESLFLTNSFDPYGWSEVFFGALGNKEFTKNFMKDLAIQKKNGFDEWYTTDKENNIKKLMADHDVRHIDAWKQVKINKKRLIILCDMVWNNFFLYELFYRFFIKIHDIKKDHIRFITSSDLEELLKEKSITERDIDVKRIDYAFFDKDISMEWDIVANNTNSTVKFEPITEKKNDFIDLITDTKWNSQLYTEDDVEEQIVKSELAYINEITILGDGNLSIPHSYCYHANGACYWEEINDEINEKKGETWYSLGRNEQSFLKKFLYGEMQSTKTMSNGETQSIMNIDGKCNVLHIGVGTGIEIEPIIDSINRQPRTIENYILADISHNLLQKTRIKRAQIKKFDGNFIEVCEDASKLTRAKIEVLHGSHPPLIIVLVANGFLMSQKKIVDNLINLMNKGDYLVITTEIKQSDEYHSGTYIGQPALNLYNVSFAPLDIRISSISDANKYLEFKYRDTGFAEYERDILEGWFKLGKWKNEKYEQPEKFSVFEQIKETAIKRSFDISNLESRITSLKKAEKIKFFESYKPTSYKSIKSYLGESLDIKNLVDEDDFNVFKKSGYKQVGLVIQKK